MSNAAPRVAPRTSLSPLEMRLYIVALLAGGYLLAWRAIATTPVNEGIPQSPFAQLEEVPGARRPVISLPPGWQLASRGESTAAVSAPRITRLPAPRDLRVRTRSS